MYNPQPLKFISGLFLVLGWFIGVIAIISSISLVFEGMLASAAYFLFGGVISGLFMILISYLITLFLKIEDNTRKTAKILYLVHQKNLDATLQTKLDSDSIQQPNESTLSEE